MRPLLGLLGALLFLSQLPSAHALTNSVKVFNFGADFAAPNPAASEVVMTRGRQLLFGYDFAAGKTNWTLRPLGGPERVAVSEDGSSIFVSLTTSNGLLQLNSATRDIIQFTRLRFSNINYNAVALLPLPGGPDSLVVGMQRAGLPDLTMRMVVLDAGVPRPRALDAVRYPQLYDGKLYCVIGDQLRIAEITGNGLELTEFTGAFSGALPGPVAVTPNFLINNAGQLRSRDTYNLHARLPVSQFGTGAPLTFPNAKRVFFWTWGDSMFTAFDLETFRGTGSFRAPSGGGINGWTDLIRLNDASMLLISSSRVGLVEPMALSPLPKADLGISGSESIEPVPRGDTFVVTLNVTNHGPAIATNVMVTNQVSSGGTQTITVSQGAIVSRGSRIVVNLGELAPGASAQVQFVVVGNPALYTVDNTANVVSDNPDPDESDNRAVVYTRILETTSEVAGRDTYFHKTALAYAPSTKKIWATLDPSAGKFGNQIVEFDPITTEVLRSFNLFTVAGNVLALTGDAQLAYVNRSVPNVLARINLTTGSNEETSVNGTIHEIYRLPSSNDTFVVLASGGAYVIDGLTKRENSLPSIGRSAAVRDNEIFFVGANGLERATIDVNGLTLVPSEPRPLADIFGDYDAFDDRFLTTSGNVIDIESREQIRRSRAYAGLSILQNESKAFYAIQTGSFLVIEDPAQQIDLKRLSWPAANSPSAFIATDDGFGIFQSGFRLMIGHSPEFRPRPPVDLTLTAKPLNPAVVSQPLQYEFTIKNVSALTATNVTFQMRDNTNVFVSATDLPVGSILSPAVEFTWKVGNLEPGQSVTGIITVTPLRAGQLLTRAAVASDSRDLTPENNRAEIANYSEIASTTDTQIQLLVGTSAFVWNPVTAKFLASPLAGESVGALEIDPLTGRVNSTDLPLPPASLLLLSDNSQILFALVETNRAVLIFDLATRLQLHRIALPSVASDIRIVPGFTHSFAVAMPDQTLIYDRDLPRPQPGLAYSTIAFSADGKSLYGFDGYYNLQPVTAQGFTEPTVRTGDFPNGGYVMFESQKNLLFTTRGQVIDMHKHKWVTSFGDPLNLLRLVPDLDAGRVYALGGDRLYMYDWETHQPFPTNYFPSGLSGPLQLSRWGGDGLAVRADHSILLMRSSNIGSAPPADLAIDLQQLSASATEARYRITVTNHSTANAASARVTLHYPSQWEVAAAPEGATYTNGLLTLNERTVAASASFTIEISLKIAPGASIVRANVATDARESATANNWSATMTTVGLPFKLSHPEHLPIPAIEVLVATNRTLAIITGLYAGPGLDCRLLTVDSFTGQLLSISPFLGFEPNKLAISDDGSHAFVSLATTGVIHRIKLSDPTRIDHTFVLDGPWNVNDMTAAPGFSNSVIFSQVAWGYSDADSAAVLLHNGVVSGKIRGVTLLSRGPRLAALGYDGLRELQLNPFRVSAPIITGTGWADLETDQNRIYAENSLVISFTGQPAPNPIPWAIVEPDPITERLFIMTPEFPGVNITALAISDLSLRSSTIYALPKYQPAVRDLSRWGADGLVFRSLDYIHLVRSGVVPVPEGDRDNDTMDDALESLIGLNPNINDSADDLDGDGSSNLNELRAGTLPQDPTSVLAVRLVFDAQTGWSLTIPSVAARRYQLLTRTSLTEGDWEVLSEETGPQQINKSITPDATARYYSVRLAP